MEKLPFSLRVKTVSLWIKIRWKVCELPALVCRNRVPAVSGRSLAVFDLKNPAEVCLIFESAFGCDFTDGKGRIFEEFGRELKSFLHYPFRG